MRRLIGMSCTVDDVIENMRKAYTIAGNDLVGSFRDQSERSLLAELLRKGSRLEIIAFLWRVRIGQLCAFISTLLASLVTRDSPWAGRMTPERICHSARTARGLVPHNLPRPATSLPSRKLAVCTIAMSVEPHKKDCMSPRAP
jgi:hypothetical protein